MATQPIVPPQPPPARPFGPLWRIVAAIAVVTTLALLLALWPFLRALSSALATWSATIAALLIIASVLLLAGGIGVVFAAALRRIGLARQAHLTQLPGGLLVRVRDIKQIGTTEAHFTMAEHFGIGRAEAERATPLLTSHNQHIHIEGTAPQIDSAPVAPQLPSLANGGGTLAQLRQLGHICRSDRSLLVGYSAGEPQYIELATCGFIGIGGSARSGKSTEALLLIEQAVLSGWHVFIADPHIHKADGLLNRCLPFSGRLAKQAVAPDEIATMIRLVDKIGRRRVQGDPDRTPVILVIDEFTNLVWRQDLPDDILRILPSMAIEYAGVGVHGMIISHDYSRAGLGSELGAALRRSFTHRIAKRMDAGNVEFLFPKGSATQARAVAGLETNHGIYHGPDGTQTVIVPWCTDMDAAYASQGTPPRPYAPKAAPQIASAPLPSGIPPTTRVPARAAPPTVPMAPPTVPEQIADLLRGRNGWMTASEIAAALAVDLATVRTELSSMSSAGQLRKRTTSGRTTKEKFEYAVQPAQHIQPTITASA